MVWVFTTTPRESTLTHLWNVTDLPHFVSSEWTRAPRAALPAAVQVEPIPVSGSIRSGRCARNSH